MRYIVIEGEKHKAEYQYWYRVTFFPPWLGAQIICSAGRTKLLESVVSVARRLQDGDELFVAFDKTPSMWAYSLLEQLSAYDITYTASFSFEEMLFTSAHPRLSLTELRRLFTECAENNRNPYSSQEVIDALRLSQYKDGWINREKAVAIELTKIAKLSAMVIKKQLGRCWTGGQTGSKECTDCGAACASVPIDVLARCNDRITHSKYRRKILLTPEMSGGQTTFDFELRGRVVLLADATASGKTLFCKRLLVAQTDASISGVLVFNVGGSSQGNALLPSEPDNVITTLNRVNGQLVVIDVADELMQSVVLRRFIERDLNNDYLLMTRDVSRYGVGATVATVAELAGTDTYRTLRYKYDFGGW